ncbi:MAG: hypothetical protein ACJ79E_00990, partial [Anaeromyxobacteraceae bacterium]
MPSTSDAARPGPVAALVRALAERRRADVTGLAGAARGWVAKELAGPGRPARLLVAVAPGE